MAYKPTVGYIADAFQNSFRQRLQQQQQEREFNQRLAETMRQNSLLNFWKQRSFEANQAYREGVLANQAEDNQRQRDAQKATEANYKANKAYNRDRLNETIRHNKAMESKGNGSDNGYKPYQAPKSFYDAMKQIDKPYYNKEQDKMAVPNQADQQVLGGYAESQLINSFPPDAYQFFNNNLKGHAFGIKSAMAKAIQAYQNGQLSDQGLDALRVYYENSKKFGGQGSLPQVTDRVFK